MKRICYEKSKHMTPPAVFLLFRTGHVDSVNSLCESFNISRSTYYGSPYYLEFEMARILGSAESKKRKIDEDAMESVAKLRERVV